MWGPTCTNRSTAPTIVAIMVRISGQPTRLWINGTIIHAVATSHASSMAASMHCISRVRALCVDVSWWISNCLTMRPSKSVFQILNDHHFGIWIKLITWHNATKGFANVRHFLCRGLNANQREEKKNQSRRTLFPRMRSILFNSWAFGMALPFS
jgi:hypothetical protein